MKAGKGKQMNNKKRPQTKQIKTRLKSNHINNYIKYYGLNILTKRQHF